MLFDFLFVQDQRSFLDVPDVKFQNNMHEVYEIKRVYQSNQSGVISCDCHLKCYKYSAQKTCQRYKAIPDLKVPSVRQNNVLVWEIAFRCNRMILNFCWKHGLQLNSWVIFFTVLHVVFPHIIFVLFRLDKRKSSFVIFSKIECCNGFIYNATTSQWYV